MTNHAGGCAGGTKSIRSGHVVFLNLERKEGVLSKRNRISLFAEAREASRRRTESEPIVLKVLSINRHHNGVNSFTEQRRVAAT